jgi:hypothetical protein
MVPVYSTRSPTAEVPWRRTTTPAPPSDWAPCGGHRLGSGGGCSALASRSPGVCHAPSSGRAVLRELPSGRVSLAARHATACACPLCGQGARGEPSAGLRRLPLSCTVPRSRASWPRDSCHAELLEQPSGRASLAARRAAQRAAQRANQGAHARGYGGCASACACPQPHVGPRSGQRRAAMARGFWSHVRATLAEEAQ